MRIALITIAMLGRIWCVPAAPQFKFYSMKHSMRNMMDLMNWLRPEPADSNLANSNDRMTSAQKQHLAQFLKREFAAGRLKRYPQKNI